MFAGAAAGVAAAAGFVRGLGQPSAGDIGNYWVDFTRSALSRAASALSFLTALIYVWQGIPQTLESWVDRLRRSKGATQQLAIGAVASFESIKHIGTNGGGFFGMNAAHPFENPTPLTNLVHILSHAPDSVCAHLRLRQHAHAAASGMGVLRARSS